MKGSDRTKTYSPREPEFDVSDPAIHIMTQGDFDDLAAIPTFDEGIPGSDEEEGEDGDDDKPNGESSSEDEEEDD